MQRCTILKGKGTRSEWIGTVTASVGWYRRRMPEVLACDVWLLVWTATCWHHACTDMQAYMYTLCPCPAQCTVAEVMVVVTIFKLHTANVLENGCARKHIQTISGFASQILLNCLKEKRGRQNKIKKMQENTETGGCLFHSSLSCAWSVYAARIAIYFVCCLA